MTTLSPDRIFDALDATWPAAQIFDVGPWKLREARGGGQRVSSATAESPVVETDIDSAEDGMRALGQRPMFMIRRGDEELDSWLSDRDYQIVDPVTAYAAPVSRMLGELPPSIVTAAWPPFAVQREIWQAGGIGSARIDVMGRVEGPKTALLGRIGDAPAGVAFVGVDRGVAMLHALEVSPSHRRSGMGATMMRGAANWAADNGAEWLTLAVTHANTAANSLYEKFGMLPVTGYHYRRAPVGSA